ncbi:CYTH and CHAD domain-containing protein [Candidatus Nitrospira allomarina]|uniref:CYTH and CHAD domain-containing protein n=1 Tax=Candidatus Nitrospira allomarina TaxID=3020900 RepID=A0AA96GD32_9BACT|nr:CYTH and CHAD domain-containing protein [Candidatus Nitrospira allomarina]WNM56554.1 CYTH and CHAD domain-containing protein [Candidatus Nitrospira allomarina]
MAWKIHQAIENEIKFRIPPRFQIPPDMGEPIPPRVFTSTYFDSEHHRLGQLGLTLRKRVEQAHGVWQLKIPSGAVRVELTIDSSSRSIPWEFQDLLTAFFRKQEAIQLGKLRTKRKGVRIRKDSQVIVEVVQDSVALIRDQKTVHSFQEVEIELQESTAAQLKPIRKILLYAGAEEKPLQPKIFQALQLPYPLALKLSDASAPPTEHIRERLHSQFLQMLQHDPGTRLGRDSEALHRMRVAIRRMRAIIRAMRTFLAPEWTEHVRQELGWVGSLLGEVRDGDVLLESFRQNFHDLSIQETRAFQSILKIFEDQRSMARAKLLEGLRSDRYLNLLNHFEDSLPRFPFQSSPLTITELAENAFHKVQDFVDASNSLFPKTDLHRTRILLKRARYAIELAEPLLGKRAKQFLKQAQHTQDLLGHHQDALVAEQRLLAIKQYSRSTGIAYVIGLMIERLRNQQSQVYQQLPKQWQKLQKHGKKL